MKTFFKAIWKFIRAYYPIIIIAPLAILTLVFTKIEFFNISELIFGILGYIFILYSFWTFVSKIEHSKWFNEFISDHDRNAYVYFIFIFAMLAFMLVCALNNYPEIKEFFRTDDR